MQDRRNVEISGELKSGDKLVLNPTPNSKRVQKITVVGKMNSATTDVPVIRIRNLSKTYFRGGQAINVLSDVNLEIAHAEFLSLMGPSGSGKSTLLNLIAGIDKPSGGEIEIGGTNIARLNEAQLADWRASNVGFIFQFYNLMPVLTAFENVELPLLRPISVVVNGKRM